MGSNGSSRMNVGKTIILARLCLQTLLFGLFIVVAYIFHGRIRKSLTETSFRLKKTGRHDSLDVQPVDHSNDSIPSKEQHEALRH